MSFVYSLMAAAISALSDRLGEDVGRFPGILDTLISTYGTSKKLTKDDVLPFVGEAGSVRVYELANAVDAGDTVPRPRRQHRRLVRIVLPVEGGGRWHRDHAHMAGVEGLDEPPRRVYRLVRQANRREAEALFLSGVGLHTLAVLGRQALAAIRSFVASRSTATAGGAA